MGIIIRQGIKNSIYSYSGFVLGALNTLLIMPRILEKSQIGLFNTLVAYAWILATLVAVGIPQVIVRFYPKYKNKDSGIFLFTCLLSALSTFSIAAIIWLIFPDLFISIVKIKERLFLENYHWVLWMAMGTLFFEIFTAILKANFLTGPSILLRELALRMFNLLIYFLYWKKWIDYSMLVTLFALSYIGIFLVLAAYVFQKKMLQLQTRILKTEKKELAKYGLYSLTNAGIIYIVFQLDVVMLQNYRGLADVALYTIALFAATAITMPYRAMLAISQPLVADAFQKNDTKSLAENYVKSSINMLLIGGFLMICLVHCMYDLKFFLPADYRNGIEQIVIILALAKWIDMSTGFNGFLISQSSYYRFDILANVILLVCAILANITFIPQYGIKGAAYATLISLILFNAIRLIYVYFKLKMSPFTKETLYGLGFLAILYSTGNFIPNLLHPVLNILLKCTIFTIAFIAGIRLLPLSDDLKGLIKKMLPGN
jgi:O-antigen/teichoic acid export membrane protein